VKKKFEDNVAGEIPNTGSEEPALPWKIDEEALAKIDSDSPGYSEIERGEPPLKTRPVVLVTLLIAVFATVLVMIAGTATENDRVKISISEKEKEAAALQVDLEKAAATLQSTAEKAAEEKAALEKSASKLEQRVNDLSAQKELFTAVLESLVKKEDLPPVQIESPAAGDQEKE
jgi:hypothetical protein